ncbi:MAG: hypothetical protein PHS51_13320, partial [Gallionella sp.]|nr:hypothetical protein [Gallionella sp.]
MNKKFNPELTSTPPTHKKHIMNDDRKRIKSLCQPQGAELAGLFKLRGQKIEAAIVLIIYALQHVASACLCNPLG